jgi:hypothetical protein
MLALVDISVLPRLDRLCTQESCFESLYVQSMRLSSFQTNPIMPPFGLVYGEPKRPVIALLRPYLLPLSPEAQALASSARALICPGANLFVSHSGGVHSFAQPSRYHDQPLVSLPLKMERLRPSYSIYYLHVCPYI